LPPKNTQPTQQATENFRLALKEASTNVNAEKFWLETSQQLYSLASKKDPQHFLQWPAIQKVMFVNTKPYVVKEYSYLRRHRQWSSLWKYVLQENKVGSPTPFLLYPKSSPNLIHLAYHIARFQNQFKENIVDADFVLEFGGGYDGMCRLFHNMGFKGQYVIFDLPAFSALQVYYLSLLRLNAKCGVNPEGVSCISKITELEQILEESFKKKMFIATWSISETPISLRNAFLKCVENFDLLLIAYQSAFFDVNNIRYFAEWSRKLCDVVWYNEEISHLKGNYYLFGKRVVQD